MLSPGDETRRGQPGAKLRIAAITMEFVTEPYFSGGVANRFFRVFKTLSDWGHDVHVIAMSESPDSSFDHCGLTVHRVRRNPAPRWFNRATRHRLANAIQWLKFSWDAKRRLLELHQQRPFDIVQFPASYGCGLATILRTDIPHVTTISCYRPLLNEAAHIPRDFQNRLLEWIEALQCRRSDHLYAPSQLLAEIVQREHGVAHVDVIRTPVCLETGELDKSVYEEHLRGRAYVLFFGRYQTHKGFHIFACALRRFFEAHPEAFAVCVGKDLGGPMGPSMGRWARQQCGPHGHRLILLDQLRHEQLYPIIGNARLIVLPSLADNLPNTLLESMAHGRPVVGTIGASFDEVITDGVDGFLVPLNHVGALAGKMIEAWEHPNLEAIGEAARRKVEEFSVERRVGELLDYYLEIIANSGTGSARRSATPFAKRTR